LIVMAIYFSFMSASMSNTRLRQLFPGRHFNQSNLSSLTIARDSSIDVNGRDPLKSSISPKHKSDTNHLNRQCNIASSSLFAAIISWTVVEAVFWIEKKTVLGMIPGVACAGIVALGSLARIQLQKISQLASRRPGRRSLFNTIRILTSNFNNVTGPMSSACFSLLFASIGVSANLEQTLRFGPSSFVFAMVALCVHVCVLIIGSSGVTKFMLPLSLEEVMVASNAAIGGPATAAAFAGASSIEGNDSNIRRRGLIMAATIFGVTGYAIATSIGVALATLLLRTSK